MKKNLMFVLCFMLVLLSFIFDGRVNAMPNSISGLRAVKTLNYNGYDQMLYKTYNGGVAFCASFHVQGVGSSCSLSSVQYSQKTQAGLAAIVKKYNSSPSERNYYYAELATNEFLYYYETKNTVNRISSTRDVRNTSGVKDFYDVAVKAYNDAKSNYEIGLTTDSGKLTFKLDGDNYVSNKVVVSKVTDYRVSVKGATGVEIFNKKDNTFYVKVPSSSVVEGGKTTIKLTVSGSKSISLTQKYNCGNGKQDIVINKILEKTISDSKNLSGEITKEKKITKLKISKQDITTKQELAGATLVLKDAKGNEIDRWVSTNTPHYLELEKGEYVLTEIQAPSGYDLSYEVIKFTVGDNSEIETAIVMYNSKTPDTADKNMIFLLSIMGIAISGTLFATYKLKHKVRIK